ncbi:RAM signaling pathway protein-domain-containing protein [Cokeromyces recurvatus]|uniref:RAM signaling pathway protein-domain-containing protein n=1 Tax=Cokeromyces recurvatus TaxID=90255 RepID=UPI00221EF27E|nr:RAM signaling pathway protein-domain-containing protein [Cokeromyces recurvatus]KAI7906457.1 RAM signaling pathway protein-domain-containing protein [Cokeromyces recurvatus]
MSKNMQSRDESSLQSTHLVCINSDYINTENNNVNLPQGEKNTSFHQHNQQQITNTRSKTVEHIIEASQTLLFTASTLQRTVGKCLGFIGNENLNTAFLPITYKLKSNNEKLTAILDVIEKRYTPELNNELVHVTLKCIMMLKELCGALRTRLSILIQGLDSKYSRNLLVILYSATVDIKESWEIISPHLTVDPMTTLTSFAQNKPATTINVKTHNELVGSNNSPLSPPLFSPNTNGDNSQLYTHLRHAVTSSLHVLNMLKQSIEKTLQANDNNISSNLEKKLNELLRQTQYATELSHRLDKDVEANMENNKDNILFISTRKEFSRRIWEDTSIYLKVIVSVMTFIRSISTEEEFTWPKPIKQGCLYVTRMTAEVAKLWNNVSTFAKDGFILEKQERSSSISEQSPN